jgi:hypothetical protein
MANTHDLVQKFLKEIKILSGKKEKMKISKNALRKKIKNYFKENHPEYKPVFYIQGSYKTKNGIRYKDDTADLDDGVYFERKPDVTATTLQKWVYSAVEGHTTGGQSHKKKCIRVIYAGDYHIDIPVLYKTDDMDHPKLAVKNEGWTDDDPKEFVDWFNEEKDIEGQLVRISMFLKAWGDHKRHSMPSGLCLTILAQKCIQYNDRDDICLKETLEEIKSELDHSWECNMPTTPYEDLFEDYDSVFQDNFMISLEAFIEDAEEAIETEERKKASKLWRKHLGNRFPIAEDDNDRSHSESKKASLAGVAGLSKPWAK